MKIETKFGMHETVLIKAINQPALILKIMLDSTDIVYNLEYWWEGEVRNVNQFEWELKSYDNISQIDPCWRG